MLLSFLPVCGWGDSSLGLMELIALPLCHLLTDGGSLVCQTNKTFPGQPGPIYTTGVRLTEGGFNGSGRNCNERSAWKLHVKMSAAIRLTFINYSKIRILTIRKVISGQKRYRTTKNIAKSDFFVPKYFFWHFFLILTLFYTVRAMLGARFEFSTMRKVISVRKRYGKTNQ